MNFPKSTALTKAKEPEYKKANWLVEASMKRLGGWKV